MSPTFGTVTNSDNKGICKGSGRKVYGRSEFTITHKMLFGNTLEILPVVPTRRGLLGLVDGTSRHLP